MKKYICLLLLVSCSLVACEKNTGGQDYNDPTGNDQTDNTPGASSLDPEKSMLALVEADNAFGIGLFKEMATENQDSNIFISPVSVALALAMTYNGAAYSTKDAMESTLKLEDLTTDQINEAYKNLMNKLINADPDVLLEIANSIWYEQNFSVKQTFFDINKTYYNAQVRPLDFADPASVDTINQWVAQNTNEKITKIIGQIADDMVMYLINAIYFKGTWKYTFDEAQTSDRPFFLSENNSKQTAFMHIEEYFDYADLNKFEALKIPYGNEDYTMVVIKPKSGSDVSDIIKALSAEQWDNWMNEFSSRETMLYLPKFKFEYEQELNDLLKSMGMEIAFNKTLADFSNINETAQLYIDKVKHKTYIEVNEEGTEAAAVTSVVIGVTSAGNNVFFDANKPFLFAIMEEETGAIVFMGRMMNPVD
jgi:serine protease inhibitor